MKNPNSLRRVVYLSPFPLSIAMASVDRRPALTDLPGFPGEKLFSLFRAWTLWKPFFAEPERFENRIVSSPEGFETHFLSGFVFFWIFIDFGDPQTSGIIDFACPAQCFLQFQQNRR